MTDSSETPGEAPRVDGARVDGARVDGAARGGPLSRFRMALIVASLFTLAVGFLGDLLLPGFFEEGRAETVVGMRKGAWFGYGLGGILSLVLALRVTRVRLMGKDPMVPMVAGFLGKLVLIALGAILIRGPLETLGDYRAFAIAFVLAVLCFQTLYYPLLERQLRRERMPSSDAD